MRLSALSQTRDREWTACEKKEHTLQLRSVELTFASGLVGAYLLAVALLASLGIPKSHLVEAAAFSPAKLSPVNSGCFQPAASSSMARPGASSQRLRRSHACSSSCVARAPSGGRRSPATSAPRSLPTRGWPARGLSVGGRGHQRRARLRYLVRLGWGVGALGAALADRCPDRARKLISIAACGLPVLAVSTTVVCRRSTCSASPFPP